MIHTKKILLFVFLIITSCSNKQVINNHGMTSLELKADKIIETKSNRNDVINIIGKPSTTSLFDKNSWFFIQREKINQSVFKLGKSKIKTNNILEITFDEYGIVKTKKLYNLNNMKDLKKVKKITQKDYDSTSGVGKLLKSLEQKINSSKSNRAKK